VGLELGLACKKERKKKKNMHWKVPLLGC